MNSQLFDQMTELYPHLGSQSVVVDVRIPGVYFGA